MSLQQIHGPTGGWCDSESKRIVVDAGQPGNGQVRILVHELAHALGVGYQEYGRHQAEVIVDTTAYTCLGALGISSEDYSIPYLASWAESSDLEILEHTAALIDRLARTIEDAALDVRS